MDVSLVWGERGGLVLGGVGKSRGCGHWPRVLRPALLPYCESQTSSGPRQVPELEWLGLPIGNRRTFTAVFLRSNYERERIPTNQLTPLITAP